MNLKSERPLWRQAVRLTTRLVYGGQMGHAQDWLPHLSLTPTDGTQAGKVHYKNHEVAELLPFDHFRERVGKVCVIVGSSPSLRKQRLDRLDPESCILLNGAACLAPERIEKPLAIAIEDERFVWRHFEMMREHIAIETPCLFSVAVLRAIAEHDPEWLRNRPLFLIDNLYKPYSGPRLTSESPKLKDVVLQGDTAALSTSPGCGVVPGGSIAITALQWAMAAGPERIGFVGVDISNADEPRFYETEFNRAPSRLRSSQESMLMQFALASDYCRRNQIRLETYSQISALLDVGIEYSSRLDAANAAH